MVKPLITDVILLSKKSSTATKADLPNVMHLMDTLEAHREHCVGMAGNMIGFYKRVLVYRAGILNIPMLNPRITGHSKEYYEAEEGCLCLEGTRQVKRWQWITVSWQDLDFKKHQQTFSGFTAEIIQHEMDHFEGKLI